MKKRYMCPMPQPSWLRLAASAQALLNGRNAQSHKTLKYQESHPPGAKSSGTREKVHSRKKKTHSTQTTGKEHAQKGQKLLAQGSALGNYGRKPVAL